MLNSTIPIEIHQNQLHRRQSRTNMKRSTNDCVMRSVLQNNDALEHHMQKNSFGKVCVKFTNNYVVFISVS